MPLREALHFVNMTLIGAGIRDRVRLGASGKIISGADIATALALGADWCTAARGFMFAIGCIQARSGHPTRCTTGAATQEPLLPRARAVTHQAGRPPNSH